MLACVRAEDWSEAKYYGDIDHFLILFLLQASRIKIRTSTQNPSAHHPCTLRSRKVITVSFLESESLQKFPMKEQWLYFT